MIRAQDAIAEFIEKTTPKDRFAADRKQLEELRALEGRANQSVNASTQKEDALIGQVETAAAQSAGDLKSLLQERLATMDAGQGLQASASAYSEQINTLQTKISEGEARQIRTEQRDTTGQKAFNRGIKLFDEAMKIIARTPSISAEAGEIIHAAVQDLQREVEMAHAITNDMLSREIDVAGAAGKYGEVAALAEIGKTYKSAFETVSVDSSLAHSLVTMQELYGPGVTPETRPDLIEPAKANLRQVFGQGNGTDANHEIAMSGLLFIMTKYKTEEMQAVIHELAMEAAKTGPFNRQQAGVFFQLLSMDNNDLKAEEFKSIVQATGAYAPALAQCLAWDDMTRSSVRAEANKLLRSNDPAISALVNGALADSAAVDFNIPKQTASLTDDKAYARITQVMNPGFKPLAAEDSAAVTESIQSDILRIFKKGQHSDAEKLVAATAVSVLMRDYDKPEMQEAYRTTIIRAVNLAMKNGIDRDGLEILMTMIMMYDGDLPSSTEVKLSQLSEQHNYPYMAHHVWKWNENPAADADLRPILERRAKSSDPYIAAPAKGLLAEPLVAAA